jgi:hypothetical protein
MAGQTTKLAIPYPTGTDRVTDGDNAMQAIAERVEARMPWGVLARAWRTTDFGPTQAEVAISGLSVTVAVGANRHVRVSTYQPNVTGTQAGTFAVFYLRQNGTRIAQGVAQVTNLGGEAIYVETVLGLAAGTYTFDVSLAAVSGSAMAGAGGTYPSNLVVEDIGSTLT